ncbi:MAG: helix-turn-helix domain-containing protein [Gemmatimonas sp.]
MPRRLPTSPPMVRTMSIGFSSGYNWTVRKSDWGQVLWASRGVITVNVGTALWVVPTHQLLWLPPGHAHSVRMAGNGVLHRIYIRRSQCRNMLAARAVLQMGALLRELMRRVLDLDTLSASEPGDVRLLAMIKTELTTAPVAPVDLPMPKDARARRAAEFVRASSDAASFSDVDAISRHAGASVRTLERAFVRDTGMTLGVWRQRARMLHAMTLLTDGDTVTQAGLKVGYATTSAFVVAFRSVVGCTPGKWNRS